MNAKDEPALIRAQLARDREVLAASLQGLRARLTPGGLVREGATGFLRGRANAYARALDDAVRSSPLALIMTGAGLVWVVFRKFRDENPARRGDTDGLSDEDWIADAEALRARADALLRRIDAAERDGLATRDELERHREAVIAALAQEVRRVMARGLDGLDNEARAATLAAREAALAATLEAGADKAPAVPVLGGALLAAAGAALAAVLPQGAAESRLLGRARDQIAAEVSRIAQGEERHLRQTGAALAEVLKTEIDQAEARLARAAVMARKAG